MTRCLHTAAPLAATLAMALSPLAHAQFDSASALGGTTVNSSSTSGTLVPMAFMRQLPVGSLRGELVLTNPPEVQLNGKTDRLAPGARMRGTNNMLVMPGAAIGQKLVVNYTRESYGLLMDVWVLREDEIAKRWPKTAEEAAKWQFDPLTQTWSKP
jgi:hypothetical protein